MEVSRDAALKLVIIDGDVLIGNKNNRILLHNLIDYTIKKAKGKDCEELSEVTLKLLVRA